tara:strand:+ start:136 stop:312 length:177 start_codon:yes stop_codon:yes gene_type:complete
MYKKEDDFKMILEYKEEIALLRMQVAEEQAQKYAAYVRIEELNQKIINMAKLDGWPQN